jgi:hypothetical protein
MANTRLCLGVEVLSGKEHLARHVQPGLWQMLDKLLRNDCDFAKCLFRVTHTSALEPVS